MPGDEWQRFANLRAYYGFMWGFPGKKLLFMGGEFGQYNEWNSNGSLDWNLLQYPLHAGIQRVIRDLNTVYRDFPPLYKRDFDPDGFEWIIHDDLDSSVFSFIRKDENGRDTDTVSAFPKQAGIGKSSIPTLSFMAEVVSITMSCWRSRFPAMAMTGRWK